ncbi:MAG TPA: GMC family oxidoreductase [Blastocatellia bacterium]|nr:GMC family oxidoreductase [Blastocatellia bacterium]
MINSGPSVGSRPTEPDQATYHGVPGAFLSRVDKEFLSRSRLRMYGGTTNHFGYWARPLEETDLRPRPGYRDASWPIDIGELNRYYPDANQTGHFGPFNYDDIDFWARALGGEPFPPLPDDSLQNAIFHAQYDPNIKNFQVQYGPELERSTNVTVLFNANVLTIESTGSKEHVEALDCRSLAGGRPNRQFKVQSRSYVLAQGGIESIRLLKLSGDLGDNKKRQLGKGFMVHPVITDAARATFPAPVSRLVTNFFREQQVTIPCAVAANQQLEAVTGPIYNVEVLANLCRLQAWGVLEPKPAVMDAEKIGNFRLIFRFAPDGRTTPVDINWEQAPNEKSTITLDLDKPDPVFGQPVVQLDWNLLEADKETIRKGLALCEQYLKAPGRNAIRFDITTDLSGGPDHWTFGSGANRLQAGDHHMGAARMSHAPDDGIVNPDLRVHSVDNLYISSCAVFPTSGYANPTLTIVALAFRLADHLNQLLA